MSAVDSATNAGNHQDLVVALNCFSEVVMRGMARANGAVGE